MYRIKRSIVSMAVLAGMIPLAPAPFVALIPAAVEAGIGALSAIVGAAGEVIGGVSEAVQSANDHGKLYRVEREPPDFVALQNELAWRTCKGNRFPSWCILDLSQGTLFAENCIRAAEWIHRHFQRPLARQ